MTGPVVQKKGEGGELLQGNDQPRNDMKLITETSSSSKAPSHKNWGDKNYLF
jgi:hypothetical protein